MARLSLSLLGPFQAVLEGKPITDFATDKTRALLAYLAVEADHPHRRDTLAGLLWPDQPEPKARQNLRQALSYLRQAIGDPADDISAGTFLFVDRQTVQFNPDSDHWLDVAAFKALADDCKKHRHSRLSSCLSCMRRLEQMAELYRGGFLEHFFLSDSSMFEEWASLEREWLQRQVVEAISHLADYYERRGDYAQARQYAWRQVALEPWREEAHRHLMQLLAMDGQRSAALFQYETCRRALIEELGVEPASETVTLYEQIRAEKNLRPTAPPQNLPPSISPLVGREEELAELADMVADPDCRLVTLLGPGGVGKTHLALRVAAEQVGAFANGVYFVPLLPLTSSALIVPTIADAIGFSFYSRQETKEQLLNYLQSKEMLLALDNMEHILDAESARLLTDILRRAPGVRLLATSRERLNLRGEWVYPVEGLTYPKDKDAKELNGYSAIELFVRRACQTERRFALSEQEAPHAVRICQIVEGIPLGIELAAVWVQTRSCREIAQEIEQNLDALTTRLHGVTERHQSIRATFEHSWQLLSPAEQELLARLSVFRGGFQWEAASAISETSLSTLSALLDKSLVRRISHDRYDMHALLRQYAAEKLETVLQTQEQAEDQHIRYFAAFMERRADSLHGAEQRQVFQEIAVEIENVRQAWRLAVARGYAHEVEQSLESLYQFCDVRCRFQEGVDLLAQAIERWREDAQQARLRGKLLARQGVLYRHLGRYKQAASVLEQSLEIFEQAGAQTDLAFCLINLANVLRHQGNPQMLEQLTRRGLDLSRQTGDLWGISRALLLLGMTQFRIGNIDQAKALFEESLAASRESRNPRLITSPLNMLGDVACHLGEYDAARVMFEECLSLSRELGDQFSVAVYLNNLGTVLHHWERYPEARRCYQESLDICRQIGDLSGQAIALSNLGEIAFIMKAYPESRRFFQEGLSIGRNIQDQWVVMACLNNLGEIACALEDWREARDYFTEALKLAVETQTSALLSKILVNMAVIFARQGQRGRAASLLALLRHHPATEQIDQEKAERLLSEMNLEPPDSDPESLEAIATSILAEMAPPSSPSASG